MPDTAFNLFLSKTFTTMTYTINARLLYVTGLLIFAAFQSFAQDYKHQVEAGVSAIRVSDKKHGGFMYQNRYTAFVHPRMGVSGTVGFLTSAYFPARSEYATRLMDQFQKNYLMGDVSAVFLPVKSTKHSIRLSGGLSWRQRSETEPIEVSKGNDQYWPSRWVVESQFIKTQDVGFHAGIGYEYAITPRFATGIEFTGYNYDRGASVLSLGLQGRYKFNISKESLGFEDRKLQLTQFGVKAGFNLSNLWEFNSLLSSRKNFHAGIFATYPMSKRFSFRSELLYSGKGARTPYFEISTPGLSFSTKATIQLHYLDVPLLINYEVFKNLRLYTGAQPGILLAQQIKTPVGKGSMEGGNKLEMSVAGGLMYDFSRFNVDVRYTHGILSVANPSNPNNQVFQASVGYMLFKK
jgi:hypothetical protein